MLSSFEIKTNRNIYIRPYSFILHWWISYARSSVSTKRGLAPATKVSVIDSDYRGELFVPLHNHSNTTQVIEPKEKIAQIVITPYIKETFEVVDSLEDTERGSGGFGSTNM